MEHQDINAEIMEYMVWVVEIVSAKFFKRDKAKAYKLLNEYGIWELYIQNYDVTHTLGASYILQEIEEILKAKGAS